MRTLIDLAENQMRFLDEVAEAAGRSRAAVIRDAVDDYLARHRVVATDAAFGLWRDQAEDGLAYQERLRAEW